MNDRDLDVAITFWNLACLAVIFGPIALMIWFRDRDRRWKLYEELPPQSRKDRSNDHDDE